MRNQRLTDRVWSQTYNVASGAYHGRPVESAPDGFLANHTFRGADAPKGARLIRAFDFSELAPPHVSAFRSGSWTRRGSDRADLAQSFRDQSVITGNVDRRKLLTAKELPAFGAEGGTRQATYQLFRLVVPTVSFERLLRFRVVTFSGFFVWLWESRGQDVVRGAYGAPLLLRGRLEGGR